MEKNCDNKNKLGTQNVLKRTTEITVSRDFFLISRLCPRQIRNFYKKYNKRDKKESFVSKEIIRKLLINSKQEEKKNCISGTRKWSHKRNRYTSASGSETEFDVKDHAQSHG